MQIELATDGGGSREGEGAAACILIDRSAKLRLKIACFIGPANGDESEIMAAILGLCTVRALAESESQKLNSVIWTTDSQYLVRMSTLLKDFERGSLGDGAGWLRDGRLRLPGTACAEPCSQNAKAGRLEKLASTE